MGKLKRIKKLNSGDVFAIPLSNGFAFCVVCVGNEIAFFDHKVDASEMPNSLVELPIAFRVLVGNGEAQAGKWIFLDNIKLSDEMLSKSNFLHKPVGSQDYFIYCDGKSVMASEEEVKGLELFTVWFAEDILRRLEELFDGKECSTTAAIKMQLNIPF
ncbi:Imm26 family immunity protein [Pseudoalteromonas luteoviolacea]|uniref:Immunity protein 26 n=1 Tax=Pseudoalteromonas luteoviolacea S4060-1 TaxID=1365257 RepID=A0A167PBA8_9GAMM|nr:Imm26 family immunity protein [Pseudoalteromonas luteoviolacea]KZN69898.1 hypothetical protein N478_10400 [Pseudoalteromonas luteoviolacea S4060-1]